MIDSQYSTSRAGAFEPGAPVEEPGGGEARPLSYDAYCQIKAPEIVYWSRGALLRADRGGRPGKPVGGKRGQIGGFTRASRLRLFRTLAKIDRSAGLPCFMTLTYHDHWPEDPREWKHLLIDRLLAQLVREHGIAGVWKLEPQKRGAPHHHLLVWGSSEADLQSDVPMRWNEIAGYGSRDHLRWHRGELGNRPCVEAVQSWAFVTRYAAKYLGKEVEWAHVGRFWGVFNRPGVPWAEEITLNVSDRKVMEFIRGMRRFARLRSRNYKSLTVMCTADQWIDKLLGQGEG